MHLIQIETLAKNALRELHHQQEEFIEPETECLVCHQCAENFKSINELHSHALGIHKDKLTINQKEEYYECEICQRYFKEPQCQMEHVESMHINCAYCSKDFLDEAEFKIHEESIHKCKKCRKYFKRKKYLKTHKESC